MTPRQARFVEEYLVDLNATAAAKRAGYSQRTAEWQGPQLLGKTHVLAAISAKQAELSRRIERTTDDVMADIAAVRRNCMQQVLDAESGAQVMISPKEALKALELEGRHLGAFERDNRQRNPLGGFDITTFFGAIFHRPKPE